MKVALFLNNSKAQARQIAEGICEFLSTKSVDLVAEKEEASFLGVQALEEVDPETIDFRVSLGGDGTILRLVHRHPKLKAPIVGVNLGGLGFLADAPLKDVYPCLQSLIDGKYIVENRITIEGAISGGENHFAVNDIVFHRASNPSLIELAIHVDGNYLNTFSADGVIVATPTGSTAYSLAAGGPILAPDLRAYVLTPISPHTISNRPIVLLPKNEIQVQYLSENNHPIEVTFDGVSSVKMQTGEVLTITPSKKPFPLVAFPYHDYFSTLRSKLGWVGKLRS
jgi:NAD+ kinase